MRRAALSGALLIVGSGLLARAASGQEACPEPKQAERASPAFPVDPESAPRPVARITRASGRFAIDGRLEEPDWEAAEVLSDFTQNQPRLGCPATERTEVRILYDDEHIYVGAIAYDSEPERLTVTSLERDFSALDNDVISVIFDTNLDRRNGFLFTVNPAGALGDAQAFDDHRSLDYTWDAVVHIATRVTEHGWILEMAIPLRTLRFERREGAQAWGFNMTRRVRRTNEVSFWAPLGRRDLVPRLSRAGTLEGFESLSQKRNLQLKPYVLGAYLADAPGAGAVLERNVNAGFDLKAGVTSSLTLDATFRTDFSHVEADEAQVNLTRFPLFFPERREFFVENSGIFLFGDVTERGFRSSVTQRDFTLFHTRRIGLTPGGQPIPIVGGLRLSGKSGPYEIGLLNMQTQAADDLPGENFGVVRARRRIGSSDVGVLFTNRQATGGEDGSANRALGVDAAFRPHQYMRIATYLAGVDTGDGTADPFAGRVSVAWRDRFWNVGTMYRRIGDGFAPGLGFVRRRGVAHYYGTLGFHHTPRGLRVQEVNPYLEVDYFTDFASVPETRNAAAGLGVSFTDGGTIQLRYGDEFERIEQPFPVASGVEIPAGEYDTRDVSASYSTNSARTLSGRLLVARGGYYGGTRQAVGVSGRWRASPHLVVDLFLDRNDVELPAGGFSADVAGLRLAMAGSTRLFGSAFLQYNGTLDEVLLNLRGRLIHSPLSDLYIVLLERRSLDADAFPGRRVERSLTIKATKTIG